MSIDRTRDFLDLTATRRAPGVRSTPLQATATAATQHLGDLQSNSAFTAEAHSVSRTLQSTSAKLAVLAKLVKKRGMLGDTGKEIERLTASIKSDMSAMSGRLDLLQGYVNHRKSAAQAAGVTPGKPLKPTQTSNAQHSASSNSADDVVLSSSHGLSHGAAVVGQLQGHLFAVTRSLKGVLEQRTESMRVQAGRRQHFGSVRDLGKPLDVSSAAGAVGEAAASVPTGATVIAMPDGRHRAGSTGTGGVSGSGSGQHRDQRMGSRLLTGAEAGQALAPASTDSAAFFQQMSLALPASAEQAYVDDRAADVESIHRHINDLAGMFGRLAHVVAEQGEQVERLEDSTALAVRHVEEGQSQLVRYFERVSDNRALLLRVAGVLVFFLILFAMLA